MSYFRSMGPRPVDVIMMARAGGPCYLRFAERDTNFSIVPYWGPLKKMLIGTGSFVKTDA